MPPLDIVLRALEQCQITAAELVITLLTSRQYKDHQLVHDLLVCSTDILNAFLQHPVTQDNVIQQSCNIVKHTYLQESGWHFGASNALTKQLEDFSIEDMASKMESCAPRWWSLLRILLGDKDTQGRAGASMDGGQDNGDEGDDILASEDDLDTYWDQVNEIDLKGLINGLTGDLVAPKLTGENKSPCSALDRRIRAAEVDKNPYHTGQPIVGRPMACSRRVRMGRGVRKSRMIWVGRVDI
ncbi:hypothetical protein PAXRUDRAFT_796535 [Paxillus rubicundulus Ve08.2h10]|uniref:Uncharacterized protein n=1 Tax=Paxillus rubicundulus Ve08.2h10 TaxID=930991 RepID=A0A0D0DYH1_9AGAM|nr:hypothetical protein PAXRUDRAFT_796535 [Paxillus rubicundulus Ve08.2h10]